MVIYRRLHSVKKVLWILAVIAFWPHLLAGQVQIIIQLPPPGQFNPEDFIHLISFQNNGSLMQTYMTATVEEEHSGTVFSGTTAPFELSPGFTMPHYSVYEPITIDYINEYYRNYVLNSNTLPSGNYVICCRLYELPGNAEVGYQCVPHTLFRPSAPVLIHPVGEVPATGTMPVFQWLPPAPLPPEPIRYRIQLAEVFGNQLPEEAITSNPPLMEWSTDQTLFSPSVGIFPLTEGKKYAWRVQSLSGILPVGENEGFSETALFTWGKREDHSITPLSPVAACVGEVNEGVSSAAALFQWMASGDFVSFQVVVTTNACGRFPGQKTPPSKPSIPNQPSKPVNPPVSPPHQPKPPVTSPVNDTVKPGGDEPPENPPVITQGGNPDTTGGGVTVVPAGGGGMGITHWPDEDEGELPALPPGWEWGPSGPRWTGEHPPAPPDLPPGWEWGPLRPVWTGKGSEPVNRKILKVSDPYTPEILNPDPGLPSNAIQEVYSTWMHLDDVLLPGQAFVYQVYGIYKDPVEGTLKGCLSEPECLRYEATADGSKPQKAPCQECVALIKTEAFPPMDGGLDPPQEILEILRDGFVTLKALGADFDQIFWYCTPKPDCPETPSTDMRPASSRVRFTWEIIAGEGDFVQIGCSGTGKTDSGNRVIYMPPYVKPDSTKETRIKLSIIDDNPSQATDQTVTRRIILKTSRKKQRPDYYKVEITSDKYQLPSASQVTNLPRGSCLTDGPYWSGENDLKTPEILLPGVKEAKKLVCREQIRLTVKDLRDPDNLHVNCKSSQCNTLGRDSMFEDDVDFEWRIKSGGGAFIKGQYGRTVVYEASGIPEEVTIEVQAFNPSGLKIIDKKQPPGKITLKVYQPGIRMDQTAADWLPKSDILLVKTSTLMYLEGETWTPGLDHQCAIHHLELIRPSNEPGICLNYPMALPATPGVFADSCPDLHFNLAKEWESWDTVFCKRWPPPDSVSCLSAKSTIPCRVQKVTLQCRDYGAYAFIKSSAKSPYLPIAWKESELLHPDRRKAIVFSDNRVTIPRDVDTNRIADCGYAPIFLANDLSMIARDTFPPASDGEKFAGNSYDGDGLTAYEEYRGFIVKSQHKRLNPRVKNLLIWDRDQIGTGNFSSSNTGGIYPVLIEADEMDTGRVINNNRKSFTQGFEQKGLRLIRYAFSPDSAYGGYADGFSIDTCHFVRINSNEFINKHNDYEKYLVAHELSHALGAYHHGEGQLAGFLPNHHSFTLDSRTMRNDTADFAWFFIACTSDLTSGDEQCWMRYPSYAAPWCRIGGTSENCSADYLEADISTWRLKTRDPRMGFGTKVTNHSGGTGTNASGNCAQGPAAGRGQCLSQLKVSMKPNTP